MESGNSPRRNYSNSPRRNYSNSPRREYFIRGYVMADNFIDSALLAPLSNHLLSRLCALCEHTDEPIEAIYNRFTEYIILDRDLDFRSIQVRKSYYYPEMPPYVRYDGELESADTDPLVMVRNRIDARASNDIVQVLNEAGFCSDGVYVEKGFIFRKGAIKVTFTDTVCLQDDEPFLKPHEIELSVVATPGQEDLVYVMKAFSEQLKPLVCWLKLPPLPHV